MATNAERALQTLINDHHSCSAKLAEFTSAGKGAPAFAAIYERRLKSLDEAIAKFSETPHATVTTLPRMGHNDSGTGGGAKS